jgi:hypothetical protein
MIIPSTRTLSLISRIQRQGGGKKLEDLWNTDCEPREETESKNCEQNRCGTRETKRTEIVRRGE